jgi:hypothetical protein
MASAASSAYAEMKEAWHFEYVISNHDGEDSDNWEAFYYPIGDAKRHSTPSRLSLRGRRHLDDGVNDSDGSQETRPDLVRGVIATRQDHLESGVARHKAQKVAECLAR